MEYEEILFTTFPHSTAITPWLRNCLVSSYLSTHICSCGARDFITDYISNLSFHSLIDTKNTSYCTQVSTTSSFSHCSSPLPGNSLFLLFVSFKSLQLNFIYGYNVETLSNFISGFPSSMTEKRLT